MQKKIAIFLSVLMLVLCIPVSAGAVSVSGEVIIQTEIFSGFDITIPQSIAQKYRWSDFGYEGANGIHFYDRSKFDAAGGKSSYEEADEAKGYLFSICQYYYDSDYRYGMGDPMFYELFQPTRNEIVAFYSRDDLSRLMILSVEYADSAPVSVKKEALRIAGYMTPASDVYMEDVDANPWNLKFANFLLNGRFRTMGQEYLDDVEMQACLYDVAGSDYPELIITNGATDGQSSRAYIYTFSENWQVEYLRTATEEELNAMPLQPFTAIRGGWGDFLEACGYQVAYLANEGEEDDAPGIPISYAGSSVELKESLFEKSAYEYDNDLAKLGAMLNKAACNGESEICQLFDQMKVEDDNIENFNYSGENAFSIAHRPMMLNGEETNLIFIVARGSQDLREFIGDYAMKANRTFLNQDAYDYVTDFEAKIWDAMRSYANGHEDLYEKPRVFFITGYSLGGAAANLTAAMANHPDLGNSWIFQDTDPTRIFAYTYGAIDSIKVNASVQTGYENIHNIFNYFDTFGPNGAKTFTTSGNSGVGKFGHIDRFAYRFSWDNNIQKAENHDISNYLTAIVEGAVECCTPYSQTAIHCPVDVEVIKNGEVVGRIMDNQVDETLLSANPDVALMVVEDSKYIGVFDSPKSYSLRITATDDGEMTVATISFNEDGESYGMAEYPNVDIENGQEFSMDLPAPDTAESDQQTPELLVMDGNRISRKVNTDGSISPVNRTGNAFQLALLAAMVIVSGLVAFWGGRKMEETEKLKFPIASIFTAILALGLLSNLQYLLRRAEMLNEKLGYRMAVEFGSTFSVLHILYQVLLIGSMLLLAVLLFMRKRNRLLVGTLAVQTLLPAFTLVSFLLNCGSRGFFDVYEYELHIGPMMWVIGICGCYVLEILCYLLFTLMAVTPCAKDGEKKGRLHRLWFLPGILSILIAFAHLVGNIYFMRSDVYCLSILFLIPMAFLFGWWMTHPYKKERPVYQIPVAQPYGQPIYQTTGVSDTAQKVFCTNCGRELPPDEDFCSICGTKRPATKGSGHIDHGGHIDL